MADIFISYAREDHPRAKLLAEAFEGRGWSVWWDTRLQAGAVWDEVIERELNTTRCVVVLWSKTSVGQHWVRVEAVEGLQRRILVSAFIEDVRPPLGFRSLQEADLTTWQGDERHPGFQQLLANIQSSLGASRQPRREIEARRRTEAEARQAAEEQRRREQDEARARRAAEAAAARAPKEAAPPGPVFPRKKWDVLKRFLVRMSGIRTKSNEPPLYPSRLAGHSTRFTVYSPIEIKPKVWFTLLVYVHTLKMQVEVEKNAKQRLEALHSRRIAETTRGIARGAEIVVIPEGSYRDPGWYRDHVTRAVTRVPSKAFPRRRAL